MIDHEPPLPRAPALPLYGPGLRAFAVCPRCAHPHDTAACPRCGKDGGRVHAAHPSLPGAAPARGAGRTPRRRSGAELVALGLIPLLGLSVVLILSWAGGV